MNKGKLFKLLILILLLVLLVILVIQNLTPVPVKFLLINIEGVPVISLILLSLLIGYIFGLLTYNLLFRGKKSKAEEKTKASAENKKIEIPSDKILETKNKKKPNKK